MLICQTGVIPRQLQQGRLFSEPAFLPSTRMESAFGALESPAIKYFRSARGCVAHRRLSPKVRTSSKMGSLTKSFGFNPSITEHASCGVAPAHRLKSEITHPCPYFLVLDPGSPQNPSSASYPRWYTVLPLLCDVSSKGARTKVVCYRG